MIFLKLHVIARAVIIIIPLIFSDSFSTTINVSVSDSRFIPSTVNAQIGDSIKWNWLTGIHTTTCDGSSQTSRPPGANSWNAEITSSNPTFVYVIAVAGIYNYKCMHHPTQLGIIDVASPHLVLNLTSVIEGFWNGSVIVSDTAGVYLHTSSSPYTRVDSSKVKLNTSGNGVLNFNNAPGGQYYIVVTQRNSIQTWSKFPQAFSSGQTLNYNFTTAANKAYGDNLKLKLGKFTNFSGDENQDGSVDVSDIVAVYNDANIFASGYLRTDMNGDDFADVADVVITYNNSINFVGVIKP